MMFGIEILKLKNYSKEKACSFFSSCTSEFCKIQSQETQKSIKEPKKPEETEIWEPRVPVVLPALNNKAPSDAILLFDGANFDYWVSSKDSTAVNWILNRMGA
jgi:hypothetical protein